MAPSGPLKSLIYPEISAYVEPIFEQRWHLFAPDPLTFSARIIVKCTEQDEWIDPTSSLLKQNEFFPFVHLQKSIFLFNSISASILSLRTNFLEETKCSKTMLKTCEENFKSWIKKEDSYSKAQSIANFVCRGEKPSPKVAVYIEHAKPFSSKYTIPNSGIEILELD